VGKSKNGFQCEVIGTDMNPAAKQFPNAIEWDFHEVKPEWLNNVDFIYSNALDHSYDHMKAITAWMSCVRPGGFCIVQWNVWGEGANPTDPFSSDIVQLTYAIIEWGKGAYCVREIIGTPLNPEYVVFVVIYKF
jgi:hypothetical protein